MNDNQVYGHRVEFSFPNCEHKSHFSAMLKSDAEKMSRDMIERQLGLCGKCYSKHCEAQGITPWYSK